ncbi:MAG: DNA alkylation repair protein [Archangiaceae bacterium]|nr:DNA alkylation repair protein [Archangiaceae bacterium]
MTLLAEVRKRLADIADAERAVQQQAYMKSAMPYHGVAAVPARAVFREVFAGYAPASAAAWRKDVLAVWNGARFREERYAAIALCQHRAARGFQRFAVLPLYRELIVSGAWWDLVDELAGNQLPLLLVADRVPMSKAMRAWARGDDLWLRRSSIICQLKLNDVMDLELLYDCIEPSMDSKEFFLRKAIGWALRQYARRDPAEVARYVKKNAARLSGLSKREALKHIG